MPRLYRRRNSDVWYYDFLTPEGKRVQRSARTTDKQVAKERARLAELGATPHARGRKQRLMDAIDAMVGSLHTRADATREMYKEKGRRLLRTMGNPFTSDITTKMLDEYIRRRRSSDKDHGRASDHTIQKELITVRRALKHAQRTGMIHQLPPWPEFSAKYKPRETWLTPEQFSLVRDELEPKRRVWASLAALAGANLSEVEAIDWGNVDLDGGRLLIPGTKRETRHRRVPIAPALRHVLEQVPKAERRGKVAEHWGNVRRDLRLAVDKANKKTAERIPYVSPNDLRRTFASWLVQNGVPLLTVATLMGHSSTRMVERVYGKLSKQNLEDAIARLPALRGVTHGVTE